MQQIKFCSLLFRSDVFYNIPLRLLCSRRAICCGSQNAPEQLCPNVTSREIAWEIGCSRLICKNIPPLIKGNLSLEQARFRYTAEADTSAVAWQVPEFAAPLLPNADAGDPVCM